MGTGFIKCSECACHSFSANQNETALVYTGLLTLICMMSKTDFFNQFTDCYLITLNLRINFYLALILKW